MNKQEILQQLSGLTSEIILQKALEDKETPNEIQLNEDGTVSFITQTKTGKMILTFCETYKVRSIWTKENQIKGVIQIITYKNDGV